MGHNVQTCFQTSQWAQCRNEPPFQAVLLLRETGPDTQAACIDCSTCMRRYWLLPDGRWMSDRPLVFLYDGEVEEAQRHSTG